METTASWIFRAILSLRRCTATYRNGCTHVGRWITVREAARLQSFHNRYVFKSSEWQMLKQIGNAVPPLLGYAAAKMAVGILEAAKKPAARSLSPGKQRPSLQQARHA